MPTPAPPLSSQVQPATSNRSSAEPAALLFALLSAYRHSRLYSVIYRNVGELERLRWGRRDLTGRARAFELLIHTVATSLLLRFLRGLRDLVTPSWNGGIAVRARAGSPFNVYVTLIVMACTVDLFDTDPSSRFHVLLLFWIVHFITFSELR
ncbi:hypothetical protein BDY21DRAFT_47956 [Lineolata rhizophorae]|uniref:Uncharacterized protein n=1 Tax=Lineolata rhizophorae TaxID=578093 RepID=A0A6A6NXW0_9PEZI|nr:hypothetical protein BDY21DRAFT_47956 [Lineolata rhizophorae]